jgi:uncharacterized membrane protein
MEQKNTRKLINTASISKVNVLFVCVLISFLFYTIKIVDDQGFWHDEIYTLSFINGLDTYLFDGSDLLSSEETSSYAIKEKLAVDTYWNNLVRNLIHEGHPPLYYLLLKLWSYAFGESEMGLRSFSIFTGLITLIVVFKIGNLLNTKASWILPALLAVCPFFIYYSIEARSYSLYLLISSICIYCTMVFKNEVSSKTCINLIVWLTLLLYTHYYGIFLYTVIVIYLISSVKNYKILVRLAVPLCVFSLYSFIVLQQTKAHSTHWTDGYIGFASSIPDFLLGSFSLLTASRDTNISLDKITIIIIVTILTVNALSGQPKLLRKIGYLLTMACIYGISIILFDKIFDHHTISVPRYYFPIQLGLIIYIYFLFIHGKSKMINYIGISALFIHFIYFDINFNSKYNNLKQMYREASSFISSKYSASDTKIVICPSGPTAIGICYYLPHDYSVILESSDKLSDLYDKQNYIFVEQRLGIDIEAWAQNANQDRYNRATRFIGLDVINKK